MQSANPNVHCCFQQCSWVIKRRALLKTAMQSAIRDCALLFLAVQISFMLMSLMNADDRRAPEDVPQERVEEEQVHNEYNCESECCLVAT